MRYFILSLAFIGATFFNAKAQSPTAPDIVFEETNHDFGTVTEGELATHEFNFTNKGKEPLILTNVKASCGCTTPQWPREPILPGQKGVIKAIYNSKGRPGAFTKSITITSNAKTPTKVVYIKGKVEKAVPANTGNPQQTPNMLNNQH